MQRPPAGTDPRRPGLLPVQGRRRSGHLRGQGQEPAAAPVELLPEPAQPAAPHRADGGDRRVRRVDPGPQRRRGADARVQPHQAAPAPVQHPARATTRATRSWPSPLDDEWPRAMVMRGSQAQGRPLLRALRPRLRHPRDARPAAAHLPHPHLLRQQARPPRAAGAARACSSTSRSARGRASARSTRRPTTSSCTS